jgi:GAF domain-containing protein
MHTAHTQLVEEFPDELLTRSLQDRRSHEIVRALGLGSSISVPLIARGRMLGAISLVSETRFRFDATDVELGEELARRAAVSIDNARLYTEHRRIAHRLQASLLPQQLPNIPGLRLAARYRPAGELTRSAATSTTSTCAPPANGSSSSATSLDTAPRRPPPPP